MRNRRYADPAPRLMMAKFPSVCPETGKSIKAGDEIAYYPWDADEHTTRCTPEQCDCETPNTPAGWGLQ